MTSTPVKPPFWDDPEGEIIRWIVLGDDYPETEIGYTKAELKERYLKTIKRRAHGFSRETSSEAGFEKAWNNLVEKRVFWYREGDVHYVHYRTYYQPYLEYHFEQSPEDQALCDELNNTDEPIIKRALQLLKRPIDFVGHSYLAGRDLDSFISEMIGMAKRRILIVSPFVHLIPLTKKLVRVKNKLKYEKHRTLDIVFFTRKPNPQDKFNYPRNTDGYDYLVKNDIDVRDMEKTHAKIVIVDDILAIVSSFNWTEYPSVGDSWEAGIVTFDLDVIDQVIKSLNDMT